MTTDDPPRLHSNSQTLSLSFSSSLIQSSMRYAAPDELVLDYTRAMMGFLLTNPAPTSLLMVGLGGGSMLKYLHRHLSNTVFSVIEISQEVIDLRDEFLIPPDSERLSTICADGGRFMREAVTQGKRFDIILVDGFDGTGLPAALCSRRFYEDCRQVLTAEGVLVANVQADTARSREIKQRLSRAFDGAVISVESDEGGNDVLTAATRQVFERCRADFETRWAGLAPEHQTTLAAASTRIQRALNKGFPCG